MPKDPQPSQAPRKQNPYPATKPSATSSRQKESDGDASTATSPKKRRKKAAGDGLANPLKAKRKSVEDDDPDANTAAGASTKKARTSVLADSMNPSINSRARREIRSSYDRLERESAAVQHNPLKRNATRIPASVAVNAQAPLAVKQKANTNRRPATPEPPLRLQNNQVARHQQRPANIRADPGPASEQAGSVPPTRPQGVRSASKAQRPRDPEDHAPAKHHSRRQEREADQTMTEIDKDGAGPVQMPRLKVIYGKKLPDPSSITEEPEEESESIPQGGSLRVNSLRASRADVTEEAEMIATRDDIDDIQPLEVLDATDYFVDAYGDFHPQGTDDDDDGIWTGITNSDPDFASGDNDGLGADFESGNDGLGDDSENDSENEPEQSRNPEEQFGSDDHDAYAPRPGPQRVFTPDSDDDAQDVLGHHKSRNRSTKIPDPVALAKYRHLQEGFGGGDDNDDDSNEPAGVDSDLEEEGEPKNKRKARTPSDETQPHLLGYYGKPWQTVLYYGQLGVQRAILRTPYQEGGLGFVPERNEHTNRELGFILATAKIRYEEQFGTIDNEWEEDEDDMIFEGMLKFLWGECSRFRGEVKKVVRHSATAWYKLEQSVEEQVAEFGDRGHNQEETALMFKQRVEEYADESRFLRGPGVDEKASSIFSGKFFHYMHEGVGKTMEVLAFGPADSSKKSCVAKEYRAEVAVPGDGLAAASAVVLRNVFDELLTGYTNVSIKLDADAYRSYYDSCLESLEDIKNHPHYSARTHGRWKMWMDNAYARRSWGAPVQKRRVAKNVLHVPL